MTELCEYDHTVLPRFRAPSAQLVRLFARDPRRARGVRYADARPRHGRGFIWALAPPGYPAHGPGPAGAAAPARRRSRHCARGAARPARQPQAGPQAGPGSTSRSRVRSRGRARMQCKARSGAAQHFARNSPPRRAKLKPGIRRSYLSRPLLHISPLLRSGGFGCGLARGHRARRAWFADPEVCFGRTPARSRARACRSGGCGLREIPATA